MFKCLFFLYLTFLLYLFSTTTTIIIIAAAVDESEIPSIPMTTINGLLTCGPRKDSTKIISFPEDVPKHTVMTRQQSKSALYDTRAEADTMAICNKMWKDFANQPRT